jgi:hypothetical protein
MAGWTTVRKTEMPVNGKLSHSWESSVAARKAQWVVVMLLILKFLWTLRHGQNMPFEWRGRQLLEKWKRRQKEN